MKKWLARVITEHEHRRSEFWIYLAFYFYGVTTGIFLYFLLEYIMKK